jgi:uncharacterized protein (UPF0332 family)
MTNEQQQLLQKAKESLKASRILLDNQLPDFSTTRAYYTMFYIAQAILLKENLTFSSHAGVISALGREFTKTQRIPIEYHRYLIDAQEKRTSADYNLNPNITIQEAQDLIKKAEEMLDFAETNLDKI